MYPSLSPGDHCTSRLLTVLGDSCLPLQAQPIKFSAERVHVSSGEVDVHLSHTLAILL